MLRNLVAAAGAVVLSALAAPPAGAIVGGVPAKADYPFMVELTIDGEHQCGGSLLRPDWVLTARHCTFVGVESRDPEPGELEVSWGRTQRESGGRTVAVDRIIRDENEHNQRFWYIEHDVALLHLAEPLPGRPIRLAGPQDAARIAPGKLATVIGWGSTSFAIGGYSDELLEVQLPIRSDDECEVRQTFIDYNPALHVCAGYDDSGESACQGDSGGPLFVADGEGYYVQLGAVDFGRGCGGTPLQMSVFAAVGKEEQKRWIVENLPPLPPPPAPAPVPAPAQPPAAAPAKAPAAKRRPARRRKPVCRTRKQRRTKRCRARARERAHGRAR